MREDEQTNKNTKKTNKNIEKKAWKIEKKYVYYKIYTIHISR